MSTTHSFENKETKCTGIKKTNSSLCVTSDLVWLRIKEPQITVRWTQDFIHSSKMPTVQQHLGLESYSLLFQGAGFEPVAPLISMVSSHLITI